jgi:hypothetical protein
MEGLGELARFLSQNGVATAASASLGVDAAAEGGPEVVITKKRAIILLSQTNFAETSLELWCEQLDEDAS